MFHTQDHNGPAFDSQSGQEHKKVKKLFIRSNKKGGRHVVKIEVRRLCGTDAPETLLKCSTLRRYSAETNLISFRFIIHRREAQEERKSSCKPNAIYFMRCTRGKVMHAGRDYPWYKLINRIKPNPSNGNICNLFPLRVVSIAHGLVDRWDTYLRCDERHLVYPSETSHSRSKRDPVADGASCVKYW